MKFSRVEKNNLIQSFKIGVIGIIVSLIINSMFKQHEVIIETTILGFIIGFLFGLFEYFISQPKLKKYRFPVVLLINFMIYAFIILISVGILAVIKMSIVNQCSLLEAIGEQNVADYFVKSDLHIFLIILIVISFFLNLFFRVTQLLGPGAMGDLVVGRYHNPTPEDKIILFLDIDDSTPLAEKLGTIEYSSLLKDFFSDITEPILKTEGKIFQYVGDEVVIVWDKKTGFKENNALKYYFYFRDCINRNKEKYIKKYGVVPTFKAGYHFGETIITEVGDLKKEIVYHGDIINTSSRIRSACKLFNRRVLISKSFLDNMNEKDEFTLENLGLQKLRGKKEEVNLFAVELKPNILSSLC